VEKPIFPAKFWREIATLNPLGRKDITEQDARDWFDFKWPVYREYRTGTGKPKHKLRVNQWWHRLTGEELERSRAFGAEKRRSVRVDKLTEIATQVFPTERTPLRTDLPPLKISRGRANG
jgi:hypothetical protein